MKFRAWDKINEKITSWEDLLIDHGQDLVVSLTNPESRWELMQSTLLFDRKGVEIYEGDILKIKESEYSNDDDNTETFYDAVYFGRYEQDEFTGIGFYTAVEEGGYGIYFCSLLESKYYFEVVGNIYENPELLRED